MTYAVRIRVDAERDIQQATAWYATEAPEQVSRFKAALRAAADRAAWRPMLTAVVRADARRIHLDAFPYAIYYLVHEQLETIEVVALVHDREDPSPKRTRLRSV